MILLMRYFKFKKIRSVTLVARGWAIKDTHTLTFVNAVSTDFVQQLLKVGQRVAFHSGLHTGDVEGDAADRCGRGKRQNKGFGRVREGEEVPKGSSTSM